MRRFSSYVLMMLLLIITAMPVQASEVKNTIHHSETLLGTGLTVIDEVIVYSHTRSSTQSYERSKTFVKDGVTIAVIAIRGSFRYDGTSVSVIFQSVTRSDTYDGWSYSQKSFSSDNGTITLNGKLTKTLVPSISFTMTLSCDKDGNISYT